MKKSEQLQARKERKELPYGVWTTDQHEVLFNREYSPIWRREKVTYNNVESIVDHEIIPWQKQQWFFNDSNPPWKDKDSYKKCRDIITRFVSGMPVAENP